MVRARSASDERESKLQGLVVAANSGTRPHITLKAVASGLNFVLAKNCHACQVYLALTGYTWQMQLPAAVE